MYGAEQAVHEISSIVGTGSNPPIICGLARALTKDIDVRGRCFRGVRNLGRRGSQSLSLIHI